MRCAGDDGGSRQEAGRVTEIVEHQGDARGRGAFVGREPRRRDGRRRRKDDNAGNPIKNCAQMTSPNEDVKSVVNDDDQRSRSLKKDDLPRESGDVKRKAS